MRSGRKKRSDGFTLIEVLIAVTLVSLLTAGLMVAMRVGQIGRASCRERV